MVSLIVVTISVTRIRPSVKTALCLACTCARMAVGVSLLSVFATDILIALTAPMKPTLGQTAQCKHKTALSHVQDSVETLQKSVTER